MPDISDAYLGVVETVAMRLSAMICDGPALRIAVDGRTAVGKSTFVRALADALSGLGRAVDMISIDGFHNPKSVRYRQCRHSPDGYYEDARDIESFRKLCLDPLGSGGDGNYATEWFDLHHDRPLDLNWKSAPEGMVALVDGTFLQRPELRPCWDFVIFLDAPLEQCLER
jgi:uridine kinase